MTVYLKIIKDKNRRRIGLVCRQCYFFGWVKTSRFICKKPEKIIDCVSNEIHFCLAASAEIEKYKERQKSQ